MGIVENPISLSYDADNQLTADGGGSYGYDANGNRNTGSDTVGTGNQMSADANWTYTYDANGNLKEKDTTTGGSSEKWDYTYDNRNELTEAKHYNAANALDMDADYAYDTFGNRSAEAVTVGSVSPVTTTTRFALNGWNPATPARIGNENFSVYADLDGSSSLKTKYLYGDNVDQLLARIDATTPLWYVTDRQGSVREVLNNSTVIKDSLSYDGFGNIITGTELNVAGRGRYAYTGRELDVETNLQYNRARYYDAATGRWISHDPLGFDAGDSNLYRYVNNRPTYATDPSGEVVIFIHGILSNGPWAQDMYDGMLAKWGRKNENLQPAINFDWHRLLGAQPGPVNAHASLAAVWADLANRNAVRKLQFLVDEIRKEVPANEPINIGDCLAV